MNILGGCNMNKRNIIIMIGIVLLLVGSVVWMEQGSKKDSKESGNAKNQIVTYEDGNQVYFPQMDEVSYDDEDSVYYYNDLLDIYLASDASKDDVKALEKEAKGKVVSQVSGATNLVQVRVTDQSKEELDEIAKALEKNELVARAQVATPVMTSVRRGNKESAEEDDWWKEAIELEEALELIDENKAELENVKVAVIEEGRLGDKNEPIDEDLKSTVQVTEESAGREFLEDDNQARLVTKLIASDKKKNKAGFSGIAADVAEVQFTGLENQLEDASSSLVTEAYLYQLLESQIKDDVSVINLSLDREILSENRYKEEGQEDLSYEDYLKTEKNTMNMISANLLTFMDELMAKEDKDFLIIQAAGNGLSSTEEEAKSSDATIDASYTGLFTNFNDEVYKLASEKAELKHNLDEILDHIVIVGAAEKKGEEYQMPAWASDGEAVDILAPGADLAISLDESGKVESVEGSAYATSMVSGAAALTWASQPQLKSGEVKERLLSGPVEVTSKDKTYPLLNLKTILPADWTLEEELLGKYARAIKEVWGPEQLDKEELGRMDSRPHPIPDVYSYELRDINGNGVNEIIFGSENDGRAFIEEIYALQGDEYVKVFEGGIRYTLTVYSDGVIEGFSPTDTAYYTLSEQGEKELELAYSSELGFAGDGVTLDNMDFEVLESKEERSKEEVRENFIKKYGEEEVQPVKHKFKKVLDY